MIRKCFNSSLTIRHVRRIIKTFKTTSGSPYYKKKVNIAFDVFLGVVFYVTCISQLDLHEVTSSFLLVVEKTKESMKQLLYWLMGAPVGLKLNKELSYCLGNFFSYHVDLWSTYLLIIYQLLPQLVRIMGCCCCLGMTLFLCFFNDVVDLLTVHMYCFYVYAANLYFAQLKGLVSLARLFTGELLSIVIQDGQLLLGSWREHIQTYEKYF